MTARTRVAKRSAKPQLVITRIFDAPRRLVFNAWTKLEHLVHWSCPHRFTLTHCEGDLPSGRGLAGARRAQGWLDGVL